MGATNRPEMLDSALLRPGRFDRQVVVDRPDLHGREAILKVHAKGVKLEKDLSLHSRCSHDSGFVGADLANRQRGSLARSKEKQECRKYAGIRRGY